MAFWNGKGESAISKVYLFLAIEGYTDLILWSRVDSRDIWVPRKECNVVQIASYFGHLEIVDAFLQSPNPTSFKDVLIYASFLGCAEAGRAASCLDQNTSTSFMLRSDLFVHTFQRTPLLGDAPRENWAREKSDFEQRRVEMQRSIASSLVGCVAYTSLEAWNQSNTQARAEPRCRSTFTFSPRLLEL